MTTTPAERSIPRWAAGTLGAMLGGAIGYWWAYKFQLGSLGRIAHKLFWDKVANSGDIDFERLARSDTFATISTSTVLVALFGALIGLLIAKRMSGKGLAEATDTDQCAGEEAARGDSSSEDATADSSVDNESVVRFAFTTVAVIIAPALVIVLGNVIGTEKERSTAEYYEPRPPQPSAPAELLAGWSLCDWPERHDQMTEVQRTKYWQRVTKEVRGQKIDLAGQVDSVSDGFDGERILYLKPLAYSSGRVKRLSVRVRSKQLRSKAEELMLDEVVVVSGTVRDCKPTLVGELWADIKPESVVKLDAFLQSRNEAEDEHATTGGGTP